MTFSARSRLFLAAATPLGVLAGLALGNRWLLPLLSAAPAYLVLAARLRRRERREAIIEMWLWAALLGLTGTFAFALWPTDPSATILGGEAYRDGMFRWIRTGEGNEGSIRLFLPIHLLHLVVFVVLAIVTAGVAAMAMGAVLMNFMAYYVASLAREGVPPLGVAAFGWQPWALCRIAAYCVLGVVLAEPLLRRLLRLPGGGLRDARRELALAATGIGADWLLKALLAPTWGRLLRDLIG